MQKFPHKYTASSSASPTHISATSDSLPAIAIDAPVQFDGPGDLWSPEQQLLAAVASCFCLTFRSIATHSNVSWQNIDISVEGTLDRVDRVTKFTHIHSVIVVTIDDNAAVEKVERIAHKADQNCLITNSLSATATATIEVKAT